MYVTLVILFAVPIRSSYLKGYPVVTESPCRSSSYPCPCRSCACACPCTVLLDITACTCFTVVDNCAGILAPSSNSSLHLVCGFAVVRSSAL